MTTALDRYDRAAAGFSARVDAMPADAWDRPAPCEGWLARDVVAHLVGWVPSFFAAAAGPVITVAPSPASDPAGAWHAFDEQVRALLADPATADASIVHPRAGAHRFEDAIDQFVLGDVLVHTWDLARAGGLDERLDPELVHDMLVGIEPMDEILRSSGQYGPRVEVPADADEQTRLIAFTGRVP